MLFSRLQLTFLTWILLTEVVNCVVEGIVCSREYALGFSISMALFNPYEWLRRSLLWFTFHKRLDQRAIFFKSTIMYNVLIVLLLIAITLKYLW